MDRERIAVFKRRALIPDYTIRERMADGCIHVVGVTASLVALTALLIIGVQSQTLLWGVSLTIYGLALVATFSFSAGYHLVVRPQAQGGPAPARSRRHLPDDRRHLYAVHPDQDATLPGGSACLPWCGPWRPSASPSSCSRRASSTGLSTALYLVQGWAVIAAWEPLMSALPGARADAAHDRRRALHRRRGVPSLGAAALSERHLARLRAVGGKLPLRGRHFRGRA